MGIDYGERFVRNTKAEGLASDSENEVAITRIERIIGTMSEKEEKLRKRLQAARYPNVDVSIGIGEWLLMSDLFDEAEVNVVFVDSKRFEEFKHTHITIALSNQAIDNPKFGLLEFIKKKATLAICHARNQKGMSHIDVLSKGNAFACSTAVISDVTKLNIFIYSKIS